ncbi:MAG: hypothetical protein WDN46_23855 [Methylocella sp.]
MANVWPAGGAVSAELKGRGVARFLGLVARHVCGGLRGDVGVTYWPRATPSRFYSGAHGAIALLGSIGFPNNQTMSRNGLTLIRVAFPAPAQ